MAHRAAGRGSGDGIDRGVLEACLGSSGEILEADVSESGGCGPDVVNTASGASFVQSRAARAQDRFSRRRTHNARTRSVAVSRFAPIARVTGYPEGYFR